MRPKSYLLILTITMLSFAMSACLPFSLAKTRKTDSKSSDKKTKTEKSSNPGEPKTLNVDKNTDYINAMGKETPEIPEFDELSAKPGKVRGYVKDINGNPLKGAQLGVRSTAVGGAYSGSQGETDDDGYYEFEVPMGVAHFYNAGYAIEWGDDSLAAIGLHPVDGKLDSFASNVGGVENFVLLPYGITSRENVQQSPHLASSYYGGSVYIHYYTVSADDNYPSEGSLVEGSVIEITLTPEGEMYGGIMVPKSFTIRKTISFRGGFYINNLPLGNYRIAVKTDKGKRLKMELNKPQNSEFGIKPSETTDSAVLTFAPSDARANMVTPQYGGWNTVEINVTQVDSKTNKPTVNKETENEEE
ncbi:MAG TPA: hypothetical protein PKY82_00330 [Pyrinomonadaceae bacterium]|nr:hypothetical protein [Pyrinomonadaceae bacterium]